MTACAPLAIGSVHRIPLLSIAAAQGLALTIITWSAARRGDGMRIGTSTVLPLVLMVIPLLQSIPLPEALHAALDPSSLPLAKSSVVPLPAHTPLSLDPPATRAHIALAAAALATFLIAYHLAAGQRRRQWFVRAVGLTGVVALAVGTGHRLFGFTKIYGLIPSNVRTLIVGPFVNPNHTAELLELTGFACLACVHLRRTALNRFGWSIAAALCFAGALATLSRGSVLALGIGMLAVVALSYVGRDKSVGRQGRAALAWTGSLAGAVILLAAALGANHLLERFQSSAGTGDIRFQVWRDSLRVLWAHPFGVGRGAFDRVYPIYRELKTNLTTRFAFVEDEPLQLLIDSGWLLFAAVIAAVVFVAWRVYRRRRGDKVEAAMLAGLLAVLAHNLIDFVLETAGVLLPFMAVLGSVLGRMEAPGPLLSPRLRMGLVGLTGFGLILGAASVAHASYDNFDKLIKATPDADARRQLLVRAQQAHPTDYFYVLQYAWLEPLKPSSGQTSSPRLHALNHALELCPSCGTVHEAIAQNLWQLSFRRQALLEWRTAAQHQPALYFDVLRQLFAAGATPNEMIAVASVDIPHMLEAAQFLNGAGRQAAALEVLNRAEQMGAPPTSILVPRADILMILGRTDEAAATLARAHALGIRSSRMAVLDAQLIQRTHRSEGAKEALAILDRAAAQDPADVALQRARLELVLALQKWTEAEPALAGLREALYRNHASPYEAYRAAARVHGQLSHWNQAVGEYRLALTDEPNDPSLWMELGRAAEAAGKIEVARDAYTQAERLAPQDPAIVNALRNLDSTRLPHAKLNPLDPGSETAQP